MSSKLYVLVEAGLSPSQQAVQAAHGVAQYCLDHPDTSWRNGTIVLLKVPELEAYVKDHDLGRHAVFREPDAGDLLTAVVGMDFKRITRMLPMV